MILFSLTLPAVAAVLLAWAFGPPPPPKRRLAIRTFQACLWAGCGLGLSSCLFFLWYPFVGHPKHGYVEFETVLGLALIALSLLRLIRGRPIAPRATAEVRDWTRWLWVPFVLSALAAGSYLVAYFAREPHGDWDAFSIWNLRARFLYRSGDDWPDTFSPVLFHTDYPLLVSALVARAWVHAGQESTAGPMAVAILFFGLTAGTLASGLNWLRGGGQGWLAGMVLLVSFPFVHAAGQQYADVPLSFFMLAAVAGLAIQDQLPMPGWWLTLGSGVAAGLAAWTKNEGVLFVGVLVASRLAVHGWNRSWRRLVQEGALFAMGLLPAGLALGVLKLGFAPPNDLLAGQGEATLRRLLDLTRHARVLAAAGQQLWEFGPLLLVVLAAYALLVGQPPEGQRCQHVGFPWLVLCLMAAGYYLVYVTTPHDLAWHLSTSLVRLIVQLWPLGLFATFLTVDAPQFSFSARSPAKTKEKARATAVRK